MEMKRRLTAILMYDVVGYSKQMALAETETFERLRSVRDAVIHPLVEESGGRVLKLMGDGGLVEFNSSPQTDTVSNPCDSTSGGSH